MRPHFHRFLRKFVFDVMPAALTSLVGALFFAHQWTREPARVDVARVAAQSEQIAAMIRDEHALMRVFLDREQELAAARQPLSIKEIKEREVAEAAAARRAAPSREPRRAAAAPAPALPPAAPPAVAAAEPPAFVAHESGPLVVAREPEGAITRIVTVAATWANRAVEASGVGAVSRLIGTVPAQAEAITDRLDAWPAGHVLDARR